MNILNLFTKGDTKQVILSLTSSDDAVVEKATEELKKLSKEKWDACKKAVIDLQKDPTANNKALTAYADLLFELGKRLSYIGTEEDIEVRKQEVEAYNKSLMVNPLNLSCLHNKGITLMQLKRWDEAVDCFGQITKIDPNYREAWRNQAISYWNGKKFEEAIQAAEEAARLDRSQQDLLDYFIKNVPYRVVHLR